MISFKNVYFSYEGNNKVLDDISFNISKGESVGLIGANGAGKTTIMKLLLGLIKGEGTILIEDKEVNKDNLVDIRKKIGYVFQNSDNQMFMPTVYEDMIFGPMNYGLSKEEVDNKVIELLKELHIEDLKDKYNSKISTGEKKMAAIATVLMNSPEILLMDEPTANLDPYNRRLIINIMNNRKETKLITSHDLDMILDTCERVILIGDGKVIADGSTESILTNKKLLEDNHLELPLSLTRSSI